MTYEDSEQGVRLMFYCILDLPEVARVVQLRPGEWRVYFRDKSEATAYPLEGRFEEDSSTIKKRLF